MTELLNANELNVFGFGRTQSHQLLLYSLKIGLIAVLINLGTNFNNKFIFQHTEK